MQCTILFGWLNTRTNDTDLNIDAEDRLWAYGQTLYRSWKDGVQTTYGSLIGNTSRQHVHDGVVYFSWAGGPFAGCDGRNNSAITGRTYDLVSAAAVNDAHIAGGKTGFADSSFDHPNGRMCGGHHAMTTIGDRLYIRDDGNNAMIDCSRVFAPPTASKT